MIDEKQVRELARTLVLIAVTGMVTTFALGVLIGWHLS